jgi:hypothetical protein
MQITPMTLAWGYRHQLPYKRKLLLITAPGDPKNEELRSTVKSVMENILDPVEYKEIDISKHPNIGKKLGLKMVKQYTVQGEGLLDRKLVEIEPALSLPQLVFLEDDVVTYQKEGIVRPYTLWAAMTRKPVYNQPADDVVPVNPF